MRKVKKKSCKSFALSLRLQQRFTFDAFGLGDGSCNNDDAGSNWNDAPWGMGFPQFDTGGGFVNTNCYYLGFCDITIFAF